MSFPSLDNPKLLFPSPPNQPNGNDVKRPPLALRLSPAILQQILNGVPLAIRLDSTSPSLIVGNTSYGLAVAPRDAASRTDLIRYSPSTSTFQTISPLAHSLIVDKVIASTPALTKEQIAGANLRAKKVEHDKLKEEKRIVTLESSPAPSSSKTSINWQKKEVSTKVKATNKLVASNKLVGKSISSRPSNSILITSGPLTASTSSTPSKLIPPKVAKETSEEMEYIPAASTSTKRKTSLVPNYRVDSPSEMESDDSDDSTKGKKRGKKGVKKVVARNGSISKKVIPAKKESITKDVEMTLVKEAPIKRKIPVIPKKAPVIVLKKVVKSNNTRAYTSSEEEEGEVHKPSPAPSTSITTSTPIITSIPIPDIVIDSASSYISARDRFVVLYSSHLSLHNLLHAERDCIRSYFAARSSNDPATAPASQPSMSLETIDGKMMELEKITKECAELKSAIWEYSFRNATPEAALTQMMGV